MTTQLIRSTTSRITLLLQTLPCFWATRFVKPQLPILISLPLQEVYKKLLELATAHPGRFFTDMTGSVVLARILTAAGTLILIITSAHDPNLTLGIPGICCLLGICVVSASMRKNYPE